MLTWGYFAVCLPHWRWMGVMVLVGQIWNDGMKAFISIVVGTYPQDSLWFYVSSTWSFVLVDMKNKRVRWMLDTHPQRIEPCKANRYEFSPPEILLDRRRTMENASNARQGPTSWSSHFDGITSIEIISVFIFGEDAKIVVILRFQIGEDKGTVSCGEMFEMRNTRESAYLLDGHVQNRSHSLVVCTCSRRNLHRPDEIQPCSSRWESCSHRCNDKNWSDQVQLEKIKRNKYALSEAFPPATISTRDGANEK